MKLNSIVRVIRRNTKQHSPLILSTLAGVGTLTTAYLTAQATVKAVRLIDKEEPVGIEYGDRKRLLIERTKLVWKFYIPAGISATSTIVCIIGANRIEANKTIAAQTALSVTQQLYSDYREHVVEELGERKEQSIRDKIAERKVKLGPPPSTDILMTGPGNVLCCELFTGRYFASDMETLRKAQNDLNAKMLAHDYISLYDFYYSVGLAPTTVSAQLGWKSNKLMQLEFSTILTDDGRPCLAFDYNYTTSL